MSNQGHCDFCFLYAFSLLYNPLTTIRHHSLSVQEMTYQNKIQNKYSDENDEELLITI